MDEIQDNEVDNSFSLRLTPRLKPEHLPKWFVTEFENDMRSGFTNETTDSNGETRTYVLEGKTRNIDSYTEWLTCFYANMFICLKTGKTCAVSLRREEYKSEHWCPVAKKMVKSSGSYLSKINLQYPVAKCLVEWLDLRGYAVIRKGENGSGYRTRFKPSQKLIEMVGWVSEELFTVAESYDELVFTDKIKIEGKERRVRCAVKITQKLKDRIKTIRKWNKLASQHDIRTPDYNCNNVVLFSSYNRCSKGLINRGGRFYALIPLQTSSDRNAEDENTNKSYQFMHRENRPKITINGNSVVELDYKAYHINMLFHMQGKTLDYDPYEFEVFPRDECKKIINAMINSDGPEAFKNFMRHGGRDENKRRWKTNVKWVYDDFLSDYEFNLAKFSKGFEKYVFEDVGVKLQYIDSEITESILNHFTAKGILCLPVHDSFIVEAQYEQELRRLMGNEYLERFNQTIQIDKKTGEIKNV